ncbi:hypothetical protein ACJX0J_004076 [Zea mays]
MTEEYELSTYDRLGVMGLLYSFIKPNSRTGKTHLLPIQQIPSFLFVAMYFFECLFIFDCRNMKSNLIFLLSIYVEFITKYIALFIENFYVEKENLEIQCHILNDTLGWIMGFSGQNVSCLYYFIMSYFPWLTILVVLPIFAGNKIVRWYTIAICLLEFLLMTYDPLIQLKEDSKWIDVFDFHWRLGIDGLSLGSILLTGFITTLATLRLGPVTRNSQLFYFLMLAILLLFFIMWELELIPVYLLFIHVGGKRRLYSATKFILYTAGGSIFFLIGVLGMGLYGSNEPGLDLERLINQSYPTTLKYYCILASLLLMLRNSIKDGSIRMIRVNMELLPHAHYLFFPLLQLLLVNEISKKEIAYSSVSHMGFIIIGIGSITNIGLNGAILQILSHGFIGATLFSWRERLNWGISIPMPKIFTMFSSFSMASLALPGMSGFVAELVVFFGLITSPKLC